MLISKSIILPDWDKFEDLEQASDILHKITEAMKDHQIQNYEDGVANFRRVTTGRIQSPDGETYFDLDSGVIRGEIVFRKGSSGLDNVEEASPNDWDNAFRLANAVKGDDDFTLISGGKIVTQSIAVGTFNSDVIARMFTNETAHINIEAWMKSGAITYIDGAKIYAGSITLTGLGTTIIEGGYIKTTLLNVDYSIIVGTKPPANADYFGGSAGALAYLNNVETAQLGSTVISGGYLRTDLIKVRKIYVGGGTDEDIYFEDSGIRLYDYHGVSGYKSINFYSGANLWTFIDTGVATILKGYQDVFQFGVDGTVFNLWKTGQLQLPNLGTAPTSNNAVGQICMVGGILKYYNGSSWVSV